MRTIVTLITAAAFLLHFALGCCAHHAHAAEGSVCSEHASDDDHGHGHGCNGHSHCGHHHSQQPVEQTPDDSDCPGHQCNDAKCAFMAAGKTVLAKDAFLTVLPLFVAEPAYNVSNSPLGVAAIDSGGLIALPVRTHLFNQVLLN